MRQLRAERLDGTRPRSRIVIRPLRREAEAHPEAMRIAHHAEQARELEGERRRRRPTRRELRSWAWAALTALAASAYGLAVAYGSGSLPHRMLDALKLFPSGFPGYDPTVSWQYLLARYLVAVVSLFVTLRVLVLLLSERFDQVAARLRRGHAVVCGLGEKGLRSTRAFRNAGLRVTCIDLDPTGDAADEARERGALVLKGDATQLLWLRTARADRAAHVVCACSDDAVNARIAALAVSLGAPLGDRAPSVHVHVRNPELAELLRATSSGLAAARLHFFNVHAVWARAMLDHREGPFAAPPDEPPRIAVLGTTALGTAVAVGAARRWHDRVRAAALDARARIVLAGPEAEAACAAIATRYPAVPRVCDLVAATDPLQPSRPPDLGALLQPGGGAAAVYVCLEDHSANLALALDAERQGDGVPVFLPATAATAELGPLLVGGEGLCAVALPEDSESLELLHDQVRETLARAVHDAYLADRRGDPGFGSEPADAAWERLREEYRSANRRHVDGILEQLRAVWLDVTPRYDWDEPLAALPPPAVEAMAELEHARWCRERLGAGWRPGAERDDARRLHPLLVPWTDLPEDAREIDRTLVRARPALLARAGYRIEPSPAREAAARLLHERYVDARLAAGETGPSLLPWDDLPEELRARNRANVDHIAVKLARIGCRAVPAVLAAGPRAAVTPDELEALARLEHERWVEERLADGWRLGPRDDESRMHSGLVPWEELPEAEREKDRETVRAIPALLERVGYAVVRDGLPS